MLYFVAPEYNCDISSDYNSLLTCREYYFSVLSFWLWYLKIAPTWVGRVILSGMAVTGLTSNASFHTNKIVFVLDLNAPRCSPRVGHHAWFFFLHASFCLIDTPLYNGSSSKNFGGRTEIALQTKRCTACVSRQHWSFLFTVC